MIQPSPPASAGSAETGAARERLIATGMLVLAMLLFAATFLDPAPGFWTLLLRRVSEASVAGGVADWFAVVALFRRPLGLPIPHTGIVPRHKERIARGLARFIETHFLDPAAVADRLRAADLTGVAAGWLSQPQNAALVADRSAQALAAVVAAIPEAELRSFVRGTAVRGISTLDLTALFALAADAIYESGRHQQVFDNLLARGRAWMAEHPDRLRTIVEDRTAWWVPKAIDRKLAQALADEVSSLLDAMAAEDSDARQEFDAAVARLAAELRTSPRWRERLEAVKRDLLSSDRLQVSLDHGADELRRLLLEAMAEKRSSMREAIAQAAQAFGRRLSEDEDLRRRMERRLVWLGRSAVQPWRPGIGRFIADVVRGWDARSVAERIENAVGRDLQYVRINGTMVGGLVGGALFLLTHWIE